MNIILWLLVGALVGWLASRIMGTDAQQGALLNIVVGVVGALLAGWIISPLLGVGTINSGDFSLGSLLVSLVGAVLLLWIVSLFRRGTVR
ncbi:MAG TPA: GlsB/YeaQ/YmgE family stress response membrane protein [Anaerolineales bacterium]|nr:GlsB/YeaQ/YmgE family stress response membrane protein [Anaerolineales bacterium]